MGGNIVKRWSALSIRHKLLLGFSVVGCVLLIVTITSLLQLRSIRQFSRNISYDNMPLMQSARSWHESARYGAHELAEDIARLQWFEMSLFSFGALFSFLVVAFTARAILHPLNRATKIAEEITSGRRDIEIDIQPTRDETGKLINALSYMQTAIQKAEDELNLRKDEMHYLAFHDPLTELPNRQYFQNELHRMLVLSERHQQRLALLFLDVDNFKLVNDNLGHDIGDLLLAAVAKRLVAVLREEDFIARLGGDEFALLLYDIKEYQFAAEVANKIIKAFESSIALESHMLKVTVSMGIASRPVGKVISSRDFLKMADIAMYKAKQAGRNGYAFYT